MNDNNDKTSFSAKLILFILFFFTILIPSMITKGATTKVFVGSLGSALLVAVIFGIVTSKKN
ncbi:hypothetical protein [Tenacibaculum discolor]|uniref:hypothetical protein n=1 Tax=Tenacibaculum discolor TaxID=361581 RepID=UPI000EAE5EEB|nr:hypothetical protein [Tenacibaculum discolor]RLJ97920.1 hypothetical protein C8N27_3022 [Tenacibaculum discolor]